MFRLLSSTALAVVLTAGVAGAQGIDSAPAANEPAATAAPAPIPATDADNVIWEKTDGAWLSDDIIGSEVVNTNGETLGEIEELLLAVVSTGADEPMADLPTADEEAAQTLYPDTGADTGMVETPETADAPLDLPSQDGGQDDGQSIDSAEIPETPGFEAQEGEHAANEGATDGVTAVEGDIAMESEPMPGESVMVPSESSEADVAVDRVVLGVGGFLGIGEKHVAVPVDRFEFFTSSDGDHKIVLDATTEELEAMADFVERDDGLMGTDAGTLTQ